MEPEKRHRSEVSEEPHRVEAPARDEAAADRAAAARLSGAQMDELGKAVDVKQVFVSFGLDQGKVVASVDGTDFVTKHASRMTLVVTPRTVELRCSPFIWLDASWPAANMNWYGVTYDLASKTAHASVSKGSGHGFVDYTADAARALEKKVLEVVAGTPLGTKGYNPMSDANILGTLGGIADNLKSMPTAGGGGAAGGVKPADMKSLSAGATIALTKGVHLDHEGGGVDIPAGGEVTLSVQGSGSVADVAGATGPQAMANAFHATAIDVSSEAITLLKSGKPVARLHELRLERGGKVTVGRFSLAGGAATAAGVEALFRLIGGAMDAHSRGAPDGLAWEMGARGAEPTIVTGMTKSALEKALGEAARKMILEHAGAIPGIDLAEAIGLR